MTTKKTENESRGTRNSPGKWHQKKRDNFMAPFPRSGPLTQQSKAEAVQKFDCGARATTSAGVYCVADWATEGKGRCEAASPRGYRQGGKSADAIPSPPLKRTPPPLATRFSSKLPGSHGSERLTKGSSRGSNSANKRGNVRLPRGQWTGLPLSRG